MPNIFDELTTPLSWIGVPPWFLAIAPWIELPFNARSAIHEPQAQFMKSLISIHAEGNSLISSPMKSLYHNCRLFSTQKGAVKIVQTAKRRKYGLEKLRNILKKFKLSINVENPHVLWGLSVSLCLLAIDKPHHSTYLCTPSGKGELRGGHRSSLRFVNSEQFFLPP